jgi:hypothetical protein
MNKRFLAVGDLLFNPDLLAYATVEEAEEGHRVRLGFSATGAASRGEVRLVGEEAAAVLRWLRLQTTPLTAASAFGPHGRPLSPETLRSSTDLEASPPAKSEWAFTGPAR